MDRDAILRGLQSIEDRVCAGDPYRFTDGTIYFQAIKLIEFLSTDKLLEAFNAGWGAAKAERIYSQEEEAKEFLNDRS